MCFVCAKIVWRVHTRCVVRGATPMHWSKGHYAQRIACEEAFAEKEQSCQFWTSDLCSLCGIDDKKEKVAHLQKERGIFSFPRQVWFAVIAEGRKEWGERQERKETKRPEKEEQNARSTMFASWFFPWNVCQISSTCFLWCLVNIVENCPQRTNKYFQSTVTIEFLFATTEAAFGCQTMVLCCHVPVVALDLSGSDFLPDSFAQFGQVAGVSASGKYISYT